MKKNSAGFIIPVLVLVILVATTVTGVYLSKAKREISQEKEKTTTQKETSQQLPSLPQTADVKEYVQSKLIDLDGDGTSEAVAIYRGESGEYGIFKVFFVIFKLKEGRWIKLIEQKLADLSQSTSAFYDPKMTLIEYTKTRNELFLSDLTGDNLPEVLIATKLEGTGAYLSAFVYGLKDKQIQELWSATNITKGVVGIEKDKVWLIMPIYGPGDPNCCPGEWTKEWWQWQKGEFKKIATVKETSLEQIKSRSYPVIR